MNLFVDMQSSTGFLDFKGAFKFAGKTGLRAVLLWLCCAHHPCTQSWSCNVKNGVWGETAGPRYFCFQKAFENPGMVMFMFVFSSCSVCGVRPPGAPPPPRLNRAHCSSSRFVQHHGVHLHMLPLGKLHCSEQQRTGPGGEGHLRGGPPERQSAGSLPGPAGRAGRQHSDTVPLHQQSSGALQLQHVWSHLLRDLHLQRHSRFCSAFQGVDGSERNRQSRNDLWFGDHVCRSHSAPRFPRGFNYMEKEDGLIGLRWLYAFSAVLQTLMMLKQLQLSSSTSS